MPATRPNIIYIVCHDLGRHLGCYGADVPSPNLDRFAAGGVTFTQAFCSSPACSPSRGCAMTGQHAHTNGLMGLVNRGWSLPEERRTIVDELNDAGYETAHFGMQHERHSAAANRYRVEGRRTESDSFAENAVAAAVAYLESRVGSPTPFYLNVGTFEVHPSRWLASMPHNRLEHYDVDPPHDVYVPPFLPDVPAVREALGQFQGAIRFLDAQVQRLFDAVERLGRRDDTLVAFTTDHGIAVHRAKTTLYDRGTEIALLLQMPGTIGVAETHSHLIQNIDILPTLLEAAGVAIPPRVQGKSFWPLLTGGTYEPHPAIVTERNWHAAQYDPMRSVRTERFHYIRNFDEHPLRQWLPHEILGGPSAAAPAFNEVWPVMTEPRAAEELYDVTADPEEFTNLAGDARHGSVKRELAAALDDWMRRTDDPLLRGPIPDRLNPWPAAAEGAARARRGRGHNTFREGGVRMAREVSVPRWSVHELAFTAATGGEANPYTDIALTATFTGPGGVRKAVPGFWDGGGTFRVRFTPDAEGAWTYATSSNDAGLAGRHGAFACVAPRPGDRGFLRRDERHPYHFRWDDGARYFMLGQTYYEIMRNAMASDNWRTAIAGSLRRGMTKVRLLVHPVWGNPHTPYPPTSPFGADLDRLNLAHWRKLDEVVAHLRDQGLVAELIPFVNEGREPQGKLFGTPEQDERYLRYVIARYAAYPNVIWCLTNEWNYTGRDRAYWNRLGEIARVEDPWSGEGERRRLLTIHQQTRLDWQFGGVAWPTHACIQYGVRNGQRTQRDEWGEDPGNRARHRHGDAWGNLSIVHNLGRDLPVVNDEYGYIGEPEDRSEPGAPALTRAKHRRIIWAIYAAGGYASAGDKATYGDGRPYMSANWHDPAEYGDIQRLAEFFTTKGIAYWRMASHNALATGGERVYVLAEPGRQYVVYAAVGGAFSLDLAPGGYAARRYDPRTGEEADLGEVAGGGARSFALPDGADWVVYLTSASARG